jgi:hypothetical protein
VESTNTNTSTNPKPSGKVRSFDFTRVSEAAFSHLLTMLVKYGAIVEGDYAARLMTHTNIGDGDDATPTPICGTIKHHMGTMHFEYDKVEHRLTLDLVHTTFLVNLAVGGIKQHVSEAMEANPL